MSGASANIVKESVGSTRTGDLASRPTATSTTTDTTGKKGVVNEQMFVLKIESDSPFQNCQNC